MSARWAHFGRSDGRDETAAENMAAESLAAASGGSHASAARTLGLSWRCASASTWWRDPGRSGMSGAP